LLRTYLTSKGVSKTKLQQLHASMKENRNTVEMHVLKDNVLPKRALEPGLYILDASATENTLPRGFIWMTQKELGKCDEIKKWKKSGNSVSDS